MLRSEPVIGDKCIRSGGYCNVANELAERLGCSPIEYKSPGNGCGPDRDGV